MEQDPSTADDENQKQSEKDPSLVDNDLQKDPATENGSKNSEEELKKETVADEKPETETEEVDSASVPLKTEMKTEEIVND